MSPEQAEGKCVDARSDVFSFGTMFYEMLAGERPFQAETANSTSAPILTREARPLSERRADVPAGVEQIVQICLRKEARWRFQSMADVEILLEAALAEKADSKPALVGSVEVGRRGLVVWTFVVLLLSVAAVTWWWARRGMRPNRARSLCVA